MQACLVRGALLKSIGDLLNLRGGAILTGPLMPGEPDIVHKHLSYQYEKDNSIT